MTDDEIINQAIKELKKSDKYYLMFEDFSFMKDLEKNSNKFNKIKKTLQKSIPLEKHTEYAIQLSTKGIEISNNFDDWFKYKKSLKPKKDYVKYIALLFTAISVFWNIYQSIINNDLKEQNELLKKQVQQNKANINFNNSKVQ